MYCFKTQPHVVTTLHYYYRASCLLSSFDTTGLMSLNVPTHLRPNNFFHHILLESQKEGERFSFLPLIPLLPVLSYWPKSLCGSAERVCKYNTIPVLSTSSLLDNLVFLLVKFTDDTKIDGLISTKDTLLLQNNVDHWAQRPCWTKCMLIEQIKANAPGN